MRLTTFGHACVRLEDHDRVLVIDPGTYSEPAALTGADAVLVTHEHADHADLSQIEAAVRADSGLMVHGPASWVADVADVLGDQVATVEAGQSFDAAGFAVTAVGGRHAEVVDGLPACANLGYLVDGLYHPGDAYFVPAEPVETLLLPAAGPWTCYRDGIGFLRAIRPARAFTIHDALLNERGLRHFDGWLEEEDTAYARIPPGGSVGL